MLSDATVILTKNSRNLSSSIADDSIHFSGREGIRIYDNNYGIPPFDIFDDKGRGIAIGKRIGHGEEGDVFELPVTGELVVKIYHKPLDSKKKEKLTVMAQICNEELKKYSAWPISLLHKEKNGEICGYVMSRVFNHEQINMLYSHYYRKKIFPRANWTFIIRAATNLAIACSVIRKYGFIIEDTDEVNILVNDQADIKLIDCGSFRVGNQRWNKFALKFHADKFVLLYTSFLILFTSCIFSVNPCLRILRVVNKIL